MGYWQQNQISQMKIKKMVKIQNVLILIGYAVNLTFIPNLLYVKNKEAL